MPSRRQSEKAFDFRGKDGVAGEAKEGLSCLFRARMLTNRAVHKKKSESSLGTPASILRVVCGERLGMALACSRSGYLA